MNAGRSGLGGFPQRLVQDGVIDESGMLAALSAAAEKKISFVTELVKSGAASARDIAVAASVEYGVPLFDLNALAIDIMLPAQTAIGADLGAFKITNGEAVIELSDPFHHGVPRLFSGGLHLWRNRDELGILA